jgi:hypothetical protein
MALSADSPQGTTISRFLNRLKYAFTDVASDITTATTSDIVVMLDASDNYTPKYADSANVLELIGTTATAAEVTRATDLSTRVVVVTADLTITEALHEGRTCVLREAGGNASVTCTMPAATGGGGRYRFVVDEVNTSNYVIKSVAGTDIMRGTIIGASTTDSATDAARTWINGASDDTLTLNGTTTGGVTRGDWIELEDIAADGWAVRGVITQSGSEATPFSNTVA